MPPARAGHLALSLAVLGAALAAGAALRTDPDSVRAAGADFSDRARRKILAHAPLPAAPASPTNAVADDPAAARLGQRLFFETRLSADGSVSCATCHDPEQSFADGRQLGQGLEQVDRHTPALWNVAHNRWFFWDGRADTLWSQALKPLETPKEHGITRLLCVRLVHEDPDLRRAYEGVFGPLPDLSDRARFPAAARPVPDEPEHPEHVAWLAMAEGDRDTVNRIYANLGKAIAAYERRLVSAGSPFDEFAAGLRGGDRDKLGALSPAAQRGLALFVGRANCELCHFGPNFTDGEFHSTGVPPLGGPPLHDAGRYQGIEDLGRDEFTASGPYSDAREGPAAEKVRTLLRSSETWGQFKTPSLRNVALTPPYMHQGQYATLEEVIRHYSTLEDAVLPSHHREQLLVPLNLTEGEIADLEAFLRSLTGKPVDEALLRDPR